MKRRTLWIRLVGVVASCLLLIAMIWRLSQPAQPREAPEAEIILQAQASLPFQILIPTYLPAGFKRNAVQIDTSVSGPQGQELVRLIYRHPTGVNLILYEWLSEDPPSPVGISEINTVRPCRCMGQDNQSSANSLMIDRGALHIMGETSDPDLLSSPHVQFILTTLAPASGLTTYTMLEQAVENIELPPAEEAKINTSGEQEVFLVVSPSTYNPVHFSVRKGIPVSLTFRQLGDVGCGNELYLPWSANEIGYLILSGQNDSQTLKFTPEQAGDFLFHCSHYYYRGIMTVIE